MKPIEGVDDMIKTIPLAILAMCLGIAEAESATRMVTVELQDGKREALVDLDSIIAILPTSDGRYSIEMSSGASYKSSKKETDQLIKILNEAGKITNYRITQ